ncbi:hypothetical protein C2E23DRAFT_708753, partial [Lenzites betulinus]
LHHFPIDPTAETLYATYMCHHIEPSSVDSYLSGICSELEVFYPAVRAARTSPLVSRTMKGFKRLRSKPIVRKRALSKDELQRALASLGASPSYDVILFATILMTGFHTLLHLGELVWPDNIALQSYRKLTMRASVKLTNGAFEFLLPAHKTDAFFEGNHVLVQRSANTPDPHSVFSEYLKKRDNLFRLRPKLWLRANSAILARSWFMSRLRGIFPRDISGHSMRAGGATSLAAAGVSPASIQ